MARSGRIMYGSEFNLDLRQRRFCEIYVSQGCLNASDAALKAGYSKNSPCERAVEQFRKPEIQRYIKKLMKEAEAASGFTKEYTLNLLKKAAEAAFKNKKHQDIETQEIVVETNVNYDGLEKCLDMRNRMIGDYAPVKTEQKTETDTKHSYESETFRKMMDDERKDC